MQATLTLMGNTVATWQTEDCDTAIEEAWNAIAAKLPGAKIEVVDASDVGARIDVNGGRWYLSLT